MVVLGGLALQIMSGYVTLGSVTLDTTLHALGLLFSGVLEYLRLELRVEILGSLVGGGDMNERSTEY